MKQRRARPLKQHHSKVWVDVWLFVVSGLLLVSITFLTGSVEVGILAVGAAAAASRAITRPAAASGELPLG